ncbi:hypothetical protein L1987_79979 [Smallanthus sonchifolius]|uniref:Uncharacterized protein n=1 Tax=Smallanthus sonchifolius TaxID=185202 RepID=A0ACB8YQM1_9ASTR|nr:hypothetical protein L1987_79979 [Smallanthus sonchifolius]
MNEINNILTTSVTRFMMFVTTSRFRSKMNEKNRVFFQEEFQRLQSRGCEGLKIFAEYFIPIFNFLHAALLDLDNSTSFFGVFDGHGGRAVSKFCAKFLHQEVLKHEAYSVGDIGIAAQKSFLRMDEMMCGQCGWRELSILGMEDDSSSEEGPPL